MTRFLQQTQIRNRLLATLPAADFARFQPHLERGSYDQGAVMEMPGEPIARAYFPEPGMVSVVVRGADGTRLEVGIIGPEGMTGLALLHGIAEASNSVFVQIPCRAIHIDAGIFCSIIEESRPVHRRLLRYAYAFSIQMAHTILCNGRFTIEVRLARWLLMCHDRADTEDLSLTHEFLSLMLGVRRAGVTTAVRRLEQAGAVKIRRGGLGIRNRDLLLECAGDSYGIPEAEYARIINA